MKKLRDRLNKKGFTLVELIVVIVIILILAAALVPNVMRYIKQARESAFQAEASAYLVEIQGFEAEYYGKENVDLDALPPTNYTGHDPSGTNKYADFKLSDFDSTISFTATSDLTPSSPKQIQVQVEKGVVKRFGYANGKHFVNWTQEAGWKDIDK